MLLHLPLLFISALDFHYVNCGIDNLRAQDWLGLVILLMLSSPHKTVSGKIADREDESVA